MQSTSSSIYSSGTSTHSSSNVSSTTTSTHHQRPQGRTKQTFPIAYPPPQKAPTCLRRFTPNLLLQIQQLSTTSNKRRHIPILEVWQPSMFNTRVAKKVPKLGAGDVYVTQCEGFLHLRANLEGGGDGKGEGEVERRVVGVVGRDAQDEGRRIIYFEDGVGWEGSNSGDGVYRVSFRDKVLEWEKDGGQGEKFVLRTADSRRVRVAKMSRTSIEVNSWSRGAREYLRDGLISESGSGTNEELDARLCTLILTSGVWVTGQEGWINTS
ncbi:uncharacterized protein ACHE_10655A [Aspergillus chevalieri]|uniref:Uncharacterized protein n=1 Tax=Aspergillus chevalieri TaxID=182096 RepID=A0A7R7ZIH4_ASPCH|nr:uncharacterized protein ACHE_10655A [Aspergillus chevalieri]BCR83253.1 hypothetical protein ACHE_10655A [Aspergillus chevalieri]